MALACSEPGCYEDAVSARFGLCQECQEDLLCIGEDEAGGNQCPNRNDDGEGFDGYCGSCADRLENAGHWGK